MGYAKSAVKGISWITLLRVLTRVITLVRLAILGRLLTPAQFGYFGIATLILSFLEIFTETGINVFLIQEKGHVKKYINSAWVVSIVRGVVLACIIFLSASIVASFFNAPQAYQIIALIGFVPLIRGFINPAIITYQKELLFHKEFLFRFVLFAVDVIISVYVGFITRNAIAFVYGLIVSAIIEVFLSYILFTTKPKIQLEIKKVKYIIRRGWWVTMTGIFSYFADNGDNLIVGKVLGSSALGMYQVAYKFSTLPISEITNVINQVIFPVFSRFSEDKERLWKAFLKVTLIGSLGAFVLGGGIFIFAKPIILIFMGRQWLAAIPAIQVLAIYGILRTMFGNFAPLFLSLGKQNYVAKMTFVRVLGLAIVVIPLVMSYGMVGAGYAMLVSMLFEIPIILYFAHKVFKKS